MGTFTCDDYNVYITDTVRPQVDVLGVDVQDVTVQMSIESHFERSTSSYSRRGAHTHIFSYKELSKLPHDIVAEALGYDSTDDPLTKIKILRDETDRLTPDAIVFEENKITVVEIKTSRSTHGVVELFHSAKNKYYEALGKRVSSMDLDFKVIVVYPAGVITNRVMDQDTVDMLVQHYLLGLFLQDSAKRVGWDPESIKPAEELMLKYFQEGFTLDEHQTNCRGEEEPLHITGSLLAKWYAIGDPGIKRIFDANVSRIRDNWKEGLELDRQKWIDRNIVLAQSRIMEFRNRTEQTKTQNQIKPIIRHPLFCVKEPSFYHTDWRRRELSNAYTNCSHYGMIYKDAITAALNDDRRFETLVSTKDEEELKTKGFWTPKNDDHRKSKRYVVKVSLSKEQRLTLAKRGVQAKSLAKTSEIREKVLRSKIPYSIFTDVQDIADSFLDLESQFRVDLNWEDPLEGKIKSLVDKSIFLSQDIKTPPNEKYLKNFLRSRIGKCLSMLNDIVEEVNISRLKHVGDSEFVFKRLPNYPVYLLIKPTATDKHIFYSILVKKSALDYASPLSEHLLDIGDFYCTEFVSLDRHRITHLLYAPYKMASLTAFWQMQFGENGIQEYCPSPRVMTHSWMSTLIYLEDKERTSANLQQVRYAYMEVVKGGYFASDPLKILNKVEKILRSRLWVFCLTRIFRAFEEMCANPPVLSTDPTGTVPLKTLDKVSGLISWVDLRPLRNFEEALNLSYLGVLHNKEEGDLMQGYLKIFDKVIDQEKKLKRANVVKMTESSNFIASNFSDHEFSATAVKSFSDFTKRYIEGKYGDYRSWAIGAILNALDRKTFSDFATSKASAPKTAEEVKLDEYMEFGKQPEFNSLSNKLRESSEGAKKCIENVSELMKHLRSQEPRPFFHLKEILNDLESNGGIHVKLFKKLQIGGTREIFILPIRARIAINFLETICRVICDELPCEMLTKGDQKVLRSDFHFGRKNRECSGRATVTSINSDDAATWAQRFVMPVFGVMLSVLVPEPFLTPCLRILNLVTSKQLVLPQELLALFYSHRHTQTFNPSIESLKNEFLNYNVDDRCLVQPNSNLLQNRSNMMQGILHYTSSLLHSCYMTSITSYIETVLSSKSTDIIDRSIVTGKVSSDDSALLITASLPREATSDQAQLATALISLFSLLKVHCYPLFCAQQSYEKSTVACFNLIEEFNSLWYFRNTLLSPSIKFVAAAVRTHVTDKIELRQNVMYGLKSQVLENTGSIFMASIVQSCQMRAHYIAMGANASGLFCTYKELLLSMPHPALGFFLTEHHLLAGIMGPNFQKYHAVKSLPVVSRIAKLVFSTTLLSEEAEDTCFSSFSITQGSRTRYLKMLNRMDLEFSEVVDYFDNHPILAFEKGRTLDESAKQVDLKAVTPSLANSFEFLTDSKQHAASSYVLHAPCVYLKERKRVARDPETNVISSTVEENKFSLIGLAYKVDSLVNQTFSSPLLQRELDILFPNSRLYEKVLYYAKLAETFHKQISRRERKTYVSISIPKTFSTFLAAPIDVYKSKWLNLPVKYTTYEVNQTYIALKGMYYWLSDSLNDTLSESPLNSVVALSQFLRSLPVSESKIRVLGTHNKMPSVEENLYSLIRRCQWPRVFLHDDTAEQTSPVIPLKRKSRRSKSASRSGSIQDLSKPLTLEEDKFERTKRRQKSRERSISPEKGPVRRSKMERTKMAFGGKPAGAKDRANAIATALWYNASLPDETPEKVRPKSERESAARVERIFTQNKPILSESDIGSEIMFSNLNSREATLAIMQHAVTHNSADISTILHCAKRGLVGNYVSPGTYDQVEKIYKGTAVFRGSYNKVSFELVSYDERACLLAVKDAKSLHKLLQGFVPLFKDLRISLDTSMSDVVRMNYDPMKGKSITHWIDIRNQEISNSWRLGRMVLLYTNVKHVRADDRVVAKLQVKEGIIRLYDARELYSTKGRKVPILTYNPKRPDMIKDDWVYKYDRRTRYTIDKGVTFNPYERFLSKETLNYGEAIYLLRSVLSDDSNSIHRFFPKIREWIERTLLRRAERRYEVSVASHAMGQLLTGSVTEEENPEELIGPPEEGFVIPEDFDDFENDEFDDILDMLDRDAKEIAGKEEKESSDLVIEAADAEKFYANWAEHEIEETLTETLSLFSQIRLPLQEPQRSDIEYEAKFWDKFLDIVKNNSSIVVRNEAFRGIYRTGSSEAIVLIARLYGAIEESPYLGSETSLCTETSEEMPSLY